MRGGRRRRGVGETESEGGGGGVHSLGWMEETEQRGGG